ncbi:hypothetical protein OH77DRAFT_133376 [Trametes cingulata]|nr:hypothetical protein OH77DRAFT_133376 [Trametes cingulata]
MAHYPTTRRQLSIGAALHFAAFFDPDSVWPQRATHLETRPRRLHQAGAYRDEFSGHRAVPQANGSGRCTTRTLAHSVWSCSEMPLHDRLGACAESVLTAQKTADTCS